MRFEGRCVFRYAIESGAKAKSAIERGQSVDGRSDARDPYQSAGRGNQPLKLQHL